MSIERSPPSLEAELEPGDPAGAIACEFTEPERDSPGRGEDTLGCLTVIVDDGFDASGGEMLAVLDLDLSCGGVDSEIPRKRVSLPFGGAGVRDGAIVLDRASRARRMFSSLLGPVDEELEAIETLVEFLDRVGISLVLEVASVISKDGQPQYYKRMKESGFV